MAGRTSADGDQHGAAAGAASAEPEVVLLSGEEVLIRPIAADDASKMVASFERLSKSSRHARFFTGIHRLGQTQLAYLTQLDHHNHEAIAAATAATHEGIGVARFVRSRERPEQAEIAVTIADSWQGRGLGSVLLQRLAQRAREEGITQFTAEVMADNHAMLALIRKLGPTEVHQDGPSLTVDVDLTPATGHPATPVGHSAQPDLPSEV